MIDLKNTDRLALMQVASFECMNIVDDCATCPYYAHVVNIKEDFEDCCISFYLKYIADKYYTERTDK